MALLRRSAIVAVSLAVLFSLVGFPLAAQAAAQTNPSINISPLRGPAGTQVQVNASGFPANARVDLGAGKVETEYTILASGTTDAQGQLNSSLAIPTRAAEGEAWVVVAALSENPSVRAFSNVFAVTGPAQAGGTYTVQPGDNLSRIAQRFGVPLDALLAANPGITNPSLIFVGQQLVIPGQGAPQPTVSISPLRGSPGTQVTVSAQGFRPNAPVDIAVGRQGTQLQVVDTAHTTDANGSLTIPVVIPASAAAGELWVVQVSTRDEPRQTAVSNVFSVVDASGTPAAPLTYTVQPGDNLWRISRSFGTTVEALLQANPGIPESNLIFPGQQLVIPSGADQPANVALMPLRGPAGSPVQINASGFPANTPVVIGVGPANAEPVVTYAGQSTNANGRLSTTVAIPTTAQPDQVYVATVRTAGTPSVSAVSNVFAVTQAAGDQPTTSVPVYLVALEQGQIGCGDAMRAVPRTVPATDQPWRAAIEALLALDESAANNAGLYNALAASNLSLDSMEVDAQGTATIRLTGSLQLGGVCDAPRVAAQLEQTALQFPAVRQVEVFVNGQPLDTVLSGQG